MQRKYKGKSWFSRWVANGRLLVFPLFPLNPKLHIPQEAITNPSISPDSGIAVTNALDFVVSTGGLLSVSHDPQLAKIKFDIDTIVNKDNKTFLFEI